MVVALLALFISLGGSAYAALNLPKNSVGNKQLKDGAVTGAKLHTNAVTSAKVKARSLLATDFKAGQLPAGPQGPKGDSGATGPQGPTGPQGATGPAGAPATRYWAKVNSDGSLAVGSSASISSAYNSGAIAVYVTFPSGVNLTHCAVLATNDGAGEHGEIDTYPDPAGLGNNVVAVENYSSTGAKTDGTPSEQPFDIAASC